MAEPASEGLMMVLVEQYGLLGLWASTFLESLGIPFASAVVIFASGPMISQGKVTVWQAILASTLGLISGSIISYTVGYYSLIWRKKLREVRKFINKRIFIFREKDVAVNELHIKVVKQSPLSNPKVQQFVEKYGSLSILLAQLFGFTRAMVSYPAGVLGIDFFKFIGLTFLGGVIFSTIAVVGSVFITRLIIYLLTSIYFWLIILIGVVCGVSYYFLRKKKNISFKFMGRGPSKR